MSESGQSSVGQILREAREAQGMTLEDAAARLRLMHRQVEAMETDHFESLDPPVFARGFVRNYARLLGLAPEVLLARMEGAPAEPTAVSPAAPPQASKSNGESFLSVNAKPDGVSTVFASFARMTDADVVMVSPFFATIG